MTTLLGDLGTRRLGRTGPEVSRFGLGTMTFGVETSEPEAHRQLDHFAEVGGTLIDTADVYGGGASESIIGSWAAQRTQGYTDMILATKARFAPRPNSAGASRRSLRAALEGSLKRLRAEAVDIYFIHGWDRDTDIDETLSTLGDFVREGKIHAIAWSNLLGWQLQKVISHARAHRLPVPVAVQPLYNLLDRHIELELLPCCAEEGLGLTPWSPLGGGWLTGKYTASARPEGATRLGEDPGRGVEAYDLRNTNRTWQILSVLEQTAQELDCPPAHVALAWLAERPGVSAPLLGARTTEQLADNLAAAALQLSKEQEQRLTQVSATGLPTYPYRFLEDWSGLDCWQRLGTSGAQ
ncbi:aldo/keto reductase [Salipiger sp. 1_MG-2023]|uniref:aldo/keto reductase n=1 Tax=Salipiger sp. 1_MG-2023 TaxID=3062665 RepID=UPI0026E129E2|nr:aldo/keto reductase [Salipiger sp. 1_MG-2023]MDO6588247.1 aldo/keto reductase [Salipiger sp. 1_MG-2023]